MKTLLSKIIMFKGDFLYCLSFGCKVYLYLSYELGYFVIKFYKYLHTPYI